MSQLRRFKILMDVRYWVPAICFLMMAGIAESSEAPQNGQPSPDSCQTGASILMEPQARDKFAKRSMLERIFSGKAPLSFGTKSWLAREYGFHVAEDISQGLMTDRVGFYLSEIEAGRLPDMQILEDDPVERMAAMEALARYKGISVLSISQAEMGVLKARGFFDRFQRLLFFGTRELPLLMRWPMRRLGWSPRLKMKGRSFLSHLESSIMEVYLAAHSDQTDLRYNIRYFIENPRRYYRELVLRRAILWALTDDFQNVLTQSGWNVTASRFQQNKPFPRIIGTGLKAGFWTVFNKGLVVPLFGVPWLPRLKIQQLGQLSQPLRQMLSDPELRQKIRSGQLSAEDEQQILKAAPVALMPVLQSLFDVARAVLALPLFVAQCLWLWDNLYFIEDIWYLAREWLSNPSLMIADLRLLQALFMQFLTYNIDPSGRLTEHYRNLLNFLFG